MRGRILVAILLLLGVPDRFAIGGEADWQDLATRPALLDYEGSPKEQLRSLGITTNVWVTQFYQGQTDGDATKAWFYGGKVDAFLKVDRLWPGFHVNVQYEHYLGDNLNREDFALIPVNTALAYLSGDGYQQALSVTTMFLSALANSI